MGTLLRRWLTAFGALDGQVKAAAPNEHLRRLEAFIEAEEPEWQKAIDEAIRRFETANLRNANASTSFGRWIPDGEDGVSASASQD
jgi:hypothetical protein